VLVLEHLSGGEMLRQLQRVKRYSEAAACALFKQVGGGALSASARVACSISGDGWLVCVWPRVPLPMRVKGWRPAACCCCVQVAAAVAYLHSLGILHRDIKVGASG
jgi:serine/threonine protein kinase